MDGIFGRGGAMTATSGCASSWFDAKSPEVDAVVANGCSGGGSSAAG